MIYKDICFVYWIHLPGHCPDDGYIGVSIDPVRRFSEHSKRTKVSKRITEEIIFHGESVLYDIIYCGTEDSCYDLEGKLRPHPYMGWNKARGGRFCPSKTLSGIKKSKPVWNKGMKIPRTIEENLIRRQKWKDKLESGYVHPNTERSKGNTNKLGKSGPPMPEQTKNALLAANTGTTRLADKTIRTFVHKDGRIECCTMLELRTKYTINQGNLQSVISGNRKSAGGWSLG